MICSSYAVSERYLLELLGVAEEVQACSVPKPGTVKRLEQQTDVLLSAYGDLQHSLFPSTPHLTGCVSTLVELVRNPAIPTRTTSKIVKLLHGFASTTFLNKLLTSQFNIFSAVMSVLQRTTREDSCTKECLKLLQKTTYGLSVSCPNGSVEDVIKYSLGIVLSSHTSAELSLLSLQLLANLCRRNNSVQIFLKALPTAETFQLQLISNISGGDITLIVVSLQILASLFLSDHSSDLGERVFCSSNTTQAFQLAFSVLSSSKYKYITMTYAVDLFVDLLTCERIHPILTSYSHLNKCLVKTVETLTSADGENMAKVLELCLALCQIPDVRKKLVQMIIHPSTCSRRETSSTSKPKKCSTPLLTLLDWACRCGNSYSTATFNALDMLREIYQEVLDGGLVQSCEESMDVILPLLVSILEPPSYSAPNPTISFSLTRTYKALAVLLVLWSVESYRAQLSAHVTEQVLNNLLKDQLQNNPIATSHPAGELPSWSAMGVNVLMLTFELCHKHKKNSRRVLFQHHIQNPALLPLLAFALLCCEQRHVAIALQIVSEICTTSEAQVINLADAIAVSHTRKEKLQCSSMLTLPHDECQHSSYEPSSHLVELGRSTASLQRKEAAGRKVVDMSSVDSLIAKFKSGLQLQELKSSEMIEIYEYKLQAMSSKESHLQDLVDAKTLALAQADRLIAQYRGRKAQNDEECLKLRSILKDAEKNCERLKEEITERESQIRMYVSKIKQLQVQNSSLQQIAEENSQLTEAFRAQTVQFESLQEIVQKKKQEIENLQRLYTTLQQQNYEIQTQYDSTLAQLEQMESEYQEMGKQLQICETKNEDLKKAVDHSLHKCTELEQAKADLKESIGKLNTDLQAAEQLTAEISHQKASLEEDCASLHAQVHEFKKRLASVENQNRLLQDEVNLFSAVKNLINRRDSKT